MAKGDRTGGFRESKPGTGAGNTVVREGAGQPEFAGPSVTSRDMG